MAKKHYRVRNWKEYNENLVKRGNITLWFEESSLKQWHETSTLKKGRGRPRKYSDMAIECGLTLKWLFNLSLRMTEGLTKSLIKLCGVEVKAPDYTTLCKRQKRLKINISKLKRRKGEGIDIVVDSTGLKLFGEGEWQIRQHGKTQVRSWRKIHLAINPKTHEIEGCYVTGHGIQDCQGFPLVLGEVKSKLEEVIGDGAYDRFSCYEEMEKRGSKGIFPPQRNASTSKEHKKYKKGISKDAILKRDEMIKSVRKWGRKKWKEKLGYHRRSLAETGIFRLKKILGTRLSSRLMENQQIEAKIKCAILNKMTAIGMPQTYCF